LGGGCHVFYPRSLQILVAGRRTQNLLKLFVIHEFSLKTIRSRFVKVLKTIVRQPLESVEILAGIRHDTMTEWRKDPEFSEAIEKATVERLLQRLERIKSGEQGWQGTAWALERIYPHRFARPEVMNQIAVVQGGKVPERVIVLSEADFDALNGREGYRQRDNGDLERVEGSLVYVIVRQQSSLSLTAGA
jgi:hypothetical protein